ncbi:unnamed protein product [Scytosiphon promiscuus]
MESNSRRRNSLLDPQSSVGSTVSEDAGVSERGTNEDSARFDEDSSSSNDDSRHDQRADLARMVSRRNLVDGGHQHRLRSSSGTAAAQAAAAAIAAQNNTGHLRRRSSMTRLPPPAGVHPAPAEEVQDESQSYQVVDFFRTVNKDAHLLKRMGSDGVHSCGGMVLRCFASCLRRVGLGNPGASVENLAFGTNDPLDFTSSKAGRPRSGGGSSVPGAGYLSGDYGVADEDMEEDEDDADEENISAQKKKVHDLGELPALNWSNATAKLLLMVVIVGVILFTTYSGWMDECVKIGELCLRAWMNGLCVAIGGYFMIELLAKCVAGFFKWTRLLHTNNKVWIFIKLHKDVSLLIWSTIILFLWEWFETTKWAPEENGVVGKILSCFLAYTATNVVSEVCKVEMAHRYMWRPYLERARASIWSQYVIFMMTDYAMGLQTKDAEGQALALGFTKTKKGGEHLSLYTVGKAIGFVHANALRHPLGPGRPGTDKDGMIDSKTGARLFGGLLYDALMINFNGDELSKLLPASPSASTTVASRENDSPSRRAPTEDPAENADADNPTTTAKSAAGAGSKGEEGVVEKSTDRGHRRSGGKRDGSGSGTSGHKGIKLSNLRQMTSKAIALKIMELFEVPPDGVVNRKEFVERIVDIFVQRRSLQLTLGDYEAILTKVGYLLSVVSAVVVFFVALRILGYDIGNLVLTWLSLTVAFSFLFGSSASAFFESIIFVFVTKAYDVGDPVFFVDDTGSEDWYIVTRINMLTTIFRRWDGQSTLVANNLMAKKAIRNQWRSGPYLHHTMIAVSIDTPAEKLDQMKNGVAAGMQRGRHRKRHGLGGLMPDTVDYQVKGLTDGNRLSVFVMCRQRENSSNMGRRFGNSSFFHKLLAKECNRLGISYTLPVQPVEMGGGVARDEAFRVRDAFLGGKMDAR